MRSTVHKNVLTLRNQDMELTLRLESLRAVRYSVVKFEPSDNSMSKNC